MTLRARLTLWTTAALGGLLLALGSAAVVLLDRSLLGSVDTSLESVARVLASAPEQPPPSGPEQALAELFGPALGERVFQFLDPRGRPEPRPPSPTRLALPLSDEAKRNAAAGRETWETVDVPGSPSPVRLLTLPVIEGGEVAHLVQVALPLSGVDAARSQFLFVLLGLAPLALGGLALGAWVLTGRALKPVEAMTEAARRIEAEDLSLRIAADGRPDELGRLASVLNDMLARLERSFAAARSFSADAAHELRTPLTILRGEIEVALRSVALEDEPRRAFESCLEEVDRLSALVEDLLFLARTDASAVERPASPVDLAAVVADAEPALLTLAERGGVTLATRTESPAVVAGSAPMLLRVLVNLVDNAVKFSGPGHRVDVEVVAADGATRLTVRDDGPGIAAADRERIFERFYRADPARSGIGAGLGLSLVRSIVELHGGRVEVESEPGRGACVRVELPLLH